MILSALPPSLPNALEYVENSVCIDPSRILSLPPKNEISLTPYLYAIFALFALKVISGTA